MPQTRKLSSAEVVALEERGPAAQSRIAARYDALLASFAVGDYGMAEPAPGETRLAVRRRQAQTAERRGWMLAFLRMEREELVFQVREVVGS